MRIREATPADAEGLRRLAGRDSAAVPEGPLMVGEVGGEIRAAVSLSTGGVIADPFHGTADLLALVYARAEQLRSRKRRRARVVARTPTSASAGAPVRAAA